MEPFSFSTLLHQNDVALPILDLLYCLLRHKALETQSVAINDGNCAHTEDERTFTTATYTMLNSAPLKV